MVVARFGFLPLKNDLRYLCNHKSACSILVEIVDSHSYWVDHFLNFMFLFRFLKDMSEFGIPSELIETRCFKMSDTSCNEISAAWTRKSNWPDDINSKWINMQRCQRRISIPCWLCGRDIQCEDELSDAFSDGAWKPQTLFMCCILKSRRKIHCCWRGTVLKVLKWFIE